MGRDAAQDPALRRGLPHEADVALLEIAHAAVDQFGATTARAGREIHRVDEEDLEARERGVAGDAGPGDPAPDDEQVDWPSAEVTERGGAGWFRSAGWTMELNRGPSWEIDLAAPEVDVSIRGLDVRGLRVTGDGTVRIGPPAVEAFVALDGDLTLIVPAGTAVQVRGAAGVPGTWEATETGSRSPGSGPLVTVDVADGAVARVQES